jgi:hypothetical protein
MLQEIITYLYFQETNWLIWNYATFTSGKLKEGLIYYEA